MSGDLTAIRLHNELDRLDSDWLNARQKWQSELGGIAANVVVSATSRGAPQLLQASDSTFIHKPLSQLWCRGKLYVH